MMERYKIDINDVQRFCYIKVRQGLLLSYIQVVLGGNSQLYETQYRGNSSDIHNGVGDQYHLTTGMVP